MFRVIIKKQKQYKQIRSQYYMRLQDKVAIITGSSRGIGAGIVKLFSQEGANVVITYNSNKEKAEALVSEISNSGKKALAIQFDAQKSFDDVVSKTIETFGKIDILVNNAGILLPASLEETTEENWNTTLGVNLTAVEKCIKAVAPFMKKQNYGKIVNISSIAGIVGSLTSVAYSVSKAGVDALTKTLSKSLAQDSITINSVAPGPIDTDMVRKNMSPESIESLRKQTPLGRIGKPEDIARAVLFFASQDSDFITGQTLIVDGGRVIR